jgi:hypothetical protein
MRLTKIVSVAVLALALSVLWVSAGPVTPLYGTGDIYAYDTQLAKGTWTIQVTNEPNKQTYFQADFSVDANLDNKFTDQDPKYKITGIPLNAIAGVSFRCTNPKFIQYSVHVNVILDIAKNGQQVAAQRNGVIDFRSDDQRTWFMILNVNADEKDGLEAVHGLSAQFSPVAIINPCP